ncbi:MAG: tetratricopeptide repeat protein [bacterium]|nr:tetratricopeptide repeat protein [bacterium]
MNLARWKDLGVFFAILFIFVLWVIKLVEENDLKLIRTPLDYLVLLYLLYSFISFLFSDSKSSAWVNLYQLFLPIILFFAAMNNLEGQKKIDRLAMFLVLTGFLAGLYGFFQFVGYDVSQWANMDRIFSTFGNAILFAGYIIFIFPVALTVILQEEKKWILYLFYIFTFILFFDMIVTQTRGGWLGFLAMAASFVYLHIKYGFFKDKKINWKKIVPAGTVICVALFGLVFWKWDILLSILTRPTARYFVWQGTVRMAISRFLFGYGIGSFPLVFPNFRTSGLLSMHPVDKNFVRHAHNEFLEIWAELGIVGLILFLAIIWLIYHLSMVLIKENKEKRSQFLTIALISGIAGDLVFNLTSIDLRFVSSSVLFWLYAGIIGLMYNMYCQEEKIYTGLSVSFKEKFMPHMPYFLFRIIVYIPLILFVFLMVKTFTQPFQAMFSMPKAEEFFSKSPIVRDNIGELEEIIKKDTTSADLYYKLGTLYAKQENWDKALENLIKSVNIDSNNPGPFNNIGNIHFTLGNIDLAIQAYKQALSIDPNHVDSHFNLAYAYFKTGKLNEAVKELDIVLKLEPENAKALKVREMIIQ